jgi:tRNA-dihydrouridine synthase 3
VVPQRLHWRPPAYHGRDDLETLMASDAVADWLLLAERAGLPRAEAEAARGFKPKHSSAAWATEPAGAPAPAGGAKAEEAGGAGGDDE